MKMGICCSVKQMGRDGWPLGGQCYFWFVVPHKKEFMISSVSTIGAVIQEICGCKNVDTYNLFGY